MKLKSIYSIKTMYVKLTQNTVPMFIIVQSSQFYFIQSKIKSHIRHSIPYHNVGMPATVMVWLIDVCLTTMEVCGTKDEAISGFGYRQSFALVLIEFVDN